MKVSTLTTNILILSLSPISTVLNLLSRHWECFFSVVNSIGCLHCHSYCLSVRRSTFALIFDWVSDYRGLSILPWHFIIEGWVLHFHLWSSRRLSHEIFHYGKFVLFFPIFSLQKTLTPSSRNSWYLSIRSLKKDWIITNVVLRWEIDSFLCFFFSIRYAHFFGEYSKRAEIFKVRPIRHMIQTKDISLLN